MVCGHRNDVVCESRRAATAGVSLIEVMVIIVILGVLTTVVALSSGIGRSAEDIADPVAAVITSTRRQALATGAPVTVRVEAAGRSVSITAMPDGRLVGVDSFDFDALSGRAVNDARVPAAIPRVRDAAAPDRHE
jgi:Tfp pilus assembly protein FimT